jgi:hypothetical protein
MSNFGDFGVASRRDRPRASHRPLRDRARLAATALALVATGCVTVPPPAGVDGGVRYTYVVLGEEGRPVARAITAATACPAIDIDGRAEPMDVRALPAVVPPRAPKGDGKIANPAAMPAAFPVLTCEKAIRDGTARATIAGRALPLPKADVRKLAIIGDTGCRMAAGPWGQVFQSCNDASAWPFASIAEAVAASTPDVVLHVGDYHYREAPCPASNAGCARSPWGYGWDAWEADFFAPAQKLLAAAPWIVVRGNHESCARAGQGWWRFLDPRPLARQQTCDDPADDAIGDFSEPYAVPLRSSLQAATQIVVFDSSLAGLAPLAPTDPIYVTYRAQFEKAFALAARGTGAFFANHQPVLAFAPNRDNPNAPYPGIASLQSVLASLQPTSYFPPTIAAVVGGHIHLLEVVSFSTPQPPQLVVGNGGVWLDPALPNPLPARATPAPGATISAMLSASSFGFVTAEREGANWRMTARDAKGAPTALCTLVAGKASCLPVLASGRP